MPSLVDWFFGRIRPDCGVYAVSGVLASGLTFLYKEIESLMRVIFAADERVINSEKPKI